MLSRFPIGGSYPNNVVIAMCSVGALCLGVSSTFVLRSEGTSTNNQNTK